MSTTPLGRVLDRFELRRGSSEPLIQAITRAAKYAQLRGKTATIHYHYEPANATSSGALTVEGQSSQHADTYDTLVMEVAPDTLQGDPPRPTPEMVQQARNMILRLYRRLYYREYSHRRQNDPELASAWRARRNEYNRRYRQKLASSPGESGG